MKQCALCWNEERQMHPVLVDARLHHYQEVCARCAQMVRDRHRNNPAAVPLLPHQSAGRPLGDLICAEAEAKRYRSVLERVFAAWDQGVPAVDVHGWIAEALRES